MPDEHGPDDPDEGAVEQGAVFAAGAVVWRMLEDGPRILLCHRDRHDDWSLPKGKVDPGETLPETAVREVLEETGFPVTLGATLGHIEYALPNGRPKEVHYWMAELDERTASASPFEPNEEVDRLEWTSTDEARRLLSYERDRQLMDVVDERFAGTTARTFPIIVLRHGKAAPGNAWPGEDASRPLTARGQAQAEAVAPIVAAFGPQLAITSPAVRCRETIAPFADAAGLTPRTEPAISQASHEESDTSEALAELAARLVADGRGTVLCSHSPVAPELISAVAAATGTSMSRLSRHSMLSTGECTVLHIPVDGPERGVVAAETHGPMA